MLVFLRKNTRIGIKMGEIHELFVVALSLVWFAGATPEKTPAKPRLKPGKNFLDNVESAQKVGDFVMS